jgi:hypothetical protein
MAFYIQSISSGKYLDIKDNNESEGAEVIIYPFHGGKNQQWKYKDGMIVSKLNGYVLNTGVAFIIPKSFDPSIKIYLPLR